MSDGYAGPKTSEFRLWYVPQVPMEAFIRDFASLAEAHRALDILVGYDLFQFEHRMRLDCSPNAGGILRWNEDEGQYEDLDDDEIEELLLAH
jgi:hypothetical protein